jgi:hypothetical protein
MAQIGKFTQPDASPKYFIEFLEFLDTREERCSPPQPKAM